MRVKFELDGKPIEKTPHAEYGVLDVVWVKHWKKAIADVRSITQHTYKHTTRVYIIACTQFVHSRTCTGCGTHLVLQEFKLSPTIELEWKMPGGAPSVASTSACSYKHPIHSSRTPYTRSLTRLASGGQHNRAAVSNGCTEGDGGAQEQTHSEEPLYGYQHRQACQSGKRTHSATGSTLAHIAHRAPQSWVRRARSRRRWANSRRAPPRSTRGRSTTKTSRCARLCICVSRVCVCVYVCE